MSRFSGTYSKRRINFRELLHAGNMTCNLNGHALEYLDEEGSRQHPMYRSFGDVIGPIAGAESWSQHRDALEIESERYRRIATAATLQVR